MKKFLNISQVSEVLNLVHPTTKKPLNHIVRYWEKAFRIIKPKKINNRKYYSHKQVEIIKMITVERLLFEYLEGVFINISVILKSYYKFLNIYLQPHLYQIS